MKRNSENKRRYERIKLPYVIKFRCVQPHAQTDWDVVNPIDMSENGICFLTVDKFIPGYKIQLHVLLTNSILMEERIYDCRVLRCDQSKLRSMFHKTVVTIENMADDAREVYFKVLHAFSEEARKNKNR